MNIFYTKSLWIALGILCASLLATPCQAAFVSSLDLESEKSKSQQRQVKAGQSRTLAEKLASIGYSQEEITVRVSDVERLSSRNNAGLLADGPERVIGR